jgi:hypothetical protein
VRCVLYIRGPGPFLGGKRQDIYWGDQLKLSFSISVRYMRTAKSSSKEGSHRSLNDLGRHECRHLHGLYSVAHGCHADWRMCVWFQAVAIISTQNFWFALLKTQLPRSPRVRTSVEFGVDTGGRRLPDKLLIVDSCDVDVDSLPVKFATCGLCAW